MYPRGIFVSHSHLGSRHGVGDPCQICLMLFLLKEFSAPTDSEVDQGNGSLYSPFSRLLCRRCIGSFPSSSPLCSSTRSTTVSRRASAVTTLTFALDMRSRLAWANYRRRYYCRCLTTFSSSMSVHYTGRVPASCPRVTHKHPCKLTHLPKSRFSISLRTPSLSGGLGSYVLTSVGLSWSFRSSCLE